MNAPSQKALLATPTFLREYDRASGVLAHLAEQEVQFLLRRMHSEPKTWLRRYDRVENTSETVLELEVGGGPRLLVHVNGAVTLCRFGSHEIVKKAVAGRSLLAELKRAQEAPPQFQAGAHSSLLPPGGGDALVKYGEEFSADWVYWLDAEQAEVAVTLLDLVETALIEGRAERRALLGGPGTGKTTILVWLLQRLSSAAPGSTESWDVRLRVTPRLQDYLRRSTGWSLEDVFRSPVIGSPDVVLVDDPQSLVDLPETGPSTSVVLAFDPLQMYKSITDAELSRLSKRFIIDWLTACYRQKEEVGRAARHVMDVVASSSPFFVEEKQKRFASERRRLTAMSNHMSYPNPSGRVRQYAPAGDEDWAEHVSWLYDLQKSDMLWRHWPPLLLCADDEVRMPKGWLRRLDGIEKDRIRLSELESVKGLEYQHVILVLSEPTFRSLDQGFTGSGRASHGTFRRMRIPFTRAKDSIATFVV